MSLSLQSFDVWQKEAGKLAQAKSWLAHIGKKGRQSDVLKLSSQHCVAPQFMIAGQYTEGGQNYWESPSAFNDAMKDIILLKFNDLSEQAIALLEMRSAAALLKSENEVAEVQAEIARAKCTIAT